MRARARVRVCVAVDGLENEKRRNHEMLGPSFLAELDVFSAHLAYAQVVPFAY